MWARLIPPAARLATAPAYRRMRANLGVPYGAQRRLLEGLIDGLARTAYGRSLGVRAGDGYPAYRAKVPVTDYAGLSPWLDRWRAGERHVLAPERVLFWQTTSGSGGPAKRIPYTAGLLGSFRRMFGAWLGDVLRHGPRLETGHVFVSLSAAARDSAPGAPQSEPEYLGGGLRSLLAPLVTPPASLLALREPASFRRALRLALLSRADRLEALSVWNPTAFTVVLDDVLAHRGTALEDCRRGEVRLEGRAFRFGSPADSSLRALEAPEVRWDEVFPRLRFLSCWSDAWAKPAAERLGAMFPRASLQGKGLLATEAPVTIPLLGASGHVPLVDEVFLEFEKPGEAPVPLWGVEPGLDYALLVTTRGGLWRYRLGDRVRCVGRLEGTPTFELLGRADGVVDLVGEKLAEPFVDGALRELGLGAETFRTLVPVRADRGASYYALWVGETIHDSSRLSRALDERLRQSVRYREARELGQLAEPVVIDRSDAERRCLEHLVSRGMRLGDIKPRSLVRQPIGDAELVEFLMSPDPGRPDSGPGRRQHVA
ncbi:MAG: GH3 auxin-responsive promoter family protein [Elusimicrobia bacterium]|nr:GH3 auxin-responsive promoter family protein [Elusimicrobiota bacterium]